MNHQWDPKNKVTAQLAQLLIEDQFPECAPVHFESLGEGWDNAAFIVNDTWVFRFPRRQVAVDLLEAENRILPFIAPLLPLPVPLPIFMGKPSKSYRWPFSGYKLIPGQTACSRDLTFDERINLAPAIAGFLKALHNIPPERVPGANPDKFHRLNLKKRISSLYKYLDHLVEKGVIEESEGIKMLVQKIRPRQVPGRITPVHGDFYSRHLLLNLKNEAAGVIDWGDFHIGDPAIDISIACGFLPGEGQSIFNEFYGEIDEYTWELARFKALYSALILLSYAHYNEDYPLMKEARTSISLVLNEGK